MYIFHVMAELLGSGIIRNEIDQQHVTVTKALRRQSERDTPRGATRNGVVDGTKCQASERRGNLFSITCMAHTTIGKKVLKEGLRLSDAKWRVFLLFIRQYLALEEWFHAHNRKDEVRKAPRKIGRVMKMLKDLFPRGEGTNGYNIPKMHGMMKMQPYILLYGSAENFHGGTGESAHKGFVKAPGLKTQRRVSEFAVQTAMQYHHVMITCHAHTSMTLGYALVEAEHANGAVPSTIMDGKYKIDMLGEDVEEKSVEEWETRLRQLQDTLGGVQSTRMGIKQYFTLTHRIEDRRGMIGHTCISLRMRTRKRTILRRCLVSSIQQMVSRR
jgi:hypothetical protein